MCLTAGAGTSVRRAQSALRGVTLTAPVRPSKGPPVLPYQGPPDLPYQGPFVLPYQGPSVLPYQEPPVWVPSVPSEPTHCYSSFFRSNQFDPLFLKSMRNSTKCVLQTDYIYFYICREIF